MMRLGLCCIFKEQPIKFRTTTATYLKKKTRSDAVAYLSEIVLHNAKSLEESIDYCKSHGIGCFRITSRFLPLATHPDFAYTVSDLPESESIFNSLKRSRSKEIRLLFHPDQFVVLNSPREDVVKNSIAEIEYQAALSDLLGADVINIHGGGVYGDKEVALNRLEEAIKMLSSSARAKLTLENDDNSYTPSDLLPVCERLGIPFVYDVHHHRCNPCELSIEEATKRALKTWDREPLFHISSPLNGWEGKNPKPHHDFINVEDFPDYWLNLKVDFTVEIEAKAKEVAIARLRQQLLDSCCEK